MSGEESAEESGVVRSLVIKLRGCQVFRTAFTAVGAAVAFGAAQLARLVVVWCGLSAALLHPQDPQ